MNFLEIYKLIDRLCIQIGNVAVLIPLEKFELGVRGIKIVECEDCMSGIYPTENYIEVGGGEEIFNDYEGYIVYSNGSIIPAFYSWDGWQPNNYNFKTRKKINKNSNHKAISRYDF